MSAVPVVPLEEQERTSSELSSSAKEIYTRILKASFTYSIAGLAPVAAGMIMLPVYTRFLRPADYGLLELLDATRTVFSMLVGSRYTESLLFFYGRSKTVEDRDSTVTTVIWGSVLLGLITVLLGWFSAPILSRLVFQEAADILDLRLALVAFGLSLPIEANMAWLRALDLSREYLALALTRLVLSILAAVVCLNLFHDKVQGVLTGNLIVTGLILLYLMGRFLLRNAGRFEWNRFLIQMRFGFLLTATGAAVFVIHFGDRFFLQRYTSLTEVGLYALAYKCGMAVSIVQAAFEQYWNGQVYRIIATEDGLNRFSRIHTYLIITLCYLAVLISASVAPLFHILVPPAYQAAAAYVPWIALTYVIRAHGDFFRSALYVEGMPGWDTAINIAASAVCAGLYQVLIPRSGPYGAIAATAAAFTMVSICAWVLAARKRRYRIEISRSGRAFALAAAVSLVFANLHFADFWTKISALIVASAAFPALLYVTGVFTAEEQRFIKSIPWRIRTRLTDSIRKQAA